MKTTEGEDYVFPGEGFGIRNTLTKRELFSLVIFQNYIGCIDGETQAVRDADKLIAALNKYKT